ncbi:hypothetical protein Lal_00041478 [Lupinus albus]|uniref:Putative histidine phosphatase superfamily n=1 Tax=Lupinus albus TaxID=3870 RepID=A0A6A5ML97_LUPAL|nr:putative histidine phosphatase superfamily [Lupinus albus]KAF1874037.1 hypothetical protein Lal_00041478 [Lupinus albus]
MDSIGIAQNETHELYQNVVVMRHAERIDKFDPLWVTKATKPWDPPLIEHGRSTAFAAGRNFRHNLDFRFHRVFVSPFLRCIQTAVEVITALSAAVDDPTAVTSDGIPIDPSKLKVSVEYGLCEMMNRQAIKLEVVPKDGNWGFDISACEAMLPSGTVDNNVERVYKELPQWEQPVLHAWARYEQIVKDLADKYPTENLLLVTHGEGVRATLSSFKDGATASKIDYCAYLELRRPIFKKDQSFIPGKFEVLTQTGQSGLSYFLPSPLSNGNSS